MLKRIKNFFHSLFIKLHLIKPKTFLVRQYGTILGSVHAAKDEAHALELMAKNFGYKTFDEFCQVLGVSPEAHKLEQIKEK